MRSASLAFANTIAGSHQMVSRCDVLFNRQVVLEGLRVIGGQINFDRTAARLARLNVTVAEPTRLPLSAGDVLSPYGYELLVWRGVQLGATSEMVPLGVFPIQTSDIDGVTLSTTITAEDRSRLVSDARFEDVTQIAAGTNYATAIQNLIATAVAGLEYVFPSVGFVTPLLTFAAQDDRWDAAKNMAKSIGHELLFDGFGRLVLRPEPTFRLAAVATIAEAANMVDVSAGLTRVTAYNKVIATGSNASNGVAYRGEAADLDPASPSYYFGPFGKKPRFFSSEFLASDTQCVAAAAGLLAANLGVTRSVNFAAIPDPRLECSDVVRIVRSALKMDKLHIIDTLTIGLSVGDAMTATTRSSQAPS